MSDAERRADSKPPACEYQMEVIVLCLFTGDIYAIGTSADSTLVVSVVEPRRHRIVNAWKIYNVTVTMSAYGGSMLSAFFSCAYSKCSNILCGMSLTFH